MINTGYVKVGKTAKLLMQDILKTSRISCGKYVDHFEKEYAKKHDVKHAITVGSGTEADIISLLALKEKYGIPDGGKVIVPSICFISVANAVLYANLEPIFVDVDPFNMNLERVDQIIKKQYIRAIIGVHFGGLPLNMEKLNKIAGKIPVIEDCACAHGTIANGKIAGSQGTLSTWSLYVAHIVTAGGGGVIGTNDDDMAEIIRSIRAYGRSCTCNPCIANTLGTQCVKRFVKGQDMRFLYQRIGLNSRMTEMEAAIGLDQLEIYDKIIKKRRFNFVKLHTLLVKKGADFVTFPHMFTKSHSISPIFFPILLDNGKDRNKVTSYLEKNGIETRNLYASIPTQQPAYKKHPQANDPFPHAEHLGKDGFYVGIHQGLKYNDLEYMATTITAAIEKG